MPTNTVNPRISYPGKHDVKVTWETMVSASRGAGQDLSHYPMKSVQVVGTFGVNGGVRIEGSNDDGATYFTLKDPNGNNLAFTAAGGGYIANSPGLIRPLVTRAGLTTDLDVIIRAARN